MTTQPHGDVIFECLQVGNSMRVTAIDAATGTEVIIQAPLSLSQGEMHTMALRKLMYVLEKKSS